MLQLNQNKEENVIEMATKKISLKQCIEELSAINTDYKYPKQAVDQAESLKSLSSDLYTDNIRFIYELIQNADDAQSRDVILTILESLCRSKDCFTMGYQTVSIRRSR